jgi:hypothetical protein
MNEEQIAHSFIEAVRNKQKLTDQIATSIIECDTS